MIALPSTFINSTCEDLLFSVSGANSSNNSSSGEIFPIKPSEISIPCPGSKTKLS